MREHGEAYRLSLERLAQDLGIKRHVSFYNRFVEFEELKAFLGVADIYITPYRHEAQAVSGTLAIASGAGNGCKPSRRAPRSSRTPEDFTGIGGMG